MRGDLKNAKTPTQAERGYPGIRFAWEFSVGDMWGKPTWAMNSLVVWDIYRGWNPTQFFRGLFHKPIQDLYKPTTRVVATQTFFLSFFTLEPWGIMIQIWQIAYHLNSQEPGTCLGPGCCWGGLRAILSCCGTSWKCGEPQHLEHWIVYTTFDRYTNGFLQSTTFLGHVLCVFFFPQTIFRNFFCWIRFESFCHPE